MAFSVQTSCAVRNCGLPPADASALMAFSVQTSFAVRNSGLSPADASAL